MHKSPARLILSSLCFQGIMLAPVVAQHTGSAPISPEAATSAYAAPTQAAYNGAAGAPAVDANGNQQALAVSASAGVTPSNYILGAEDTITVRVFAADDIPDRPAQIGNDGTVTLPMVGQIHAAGLTVDQLQASLVIAYKKYFKDPQVTVQVTDYRSQPVSVAGNVAMPGVI